MIITTNCNKNQQASPAFVTDCLQIDDNCGDISREKAPTNRLIPYSRPPNFKTLYRPKIGVLEGLKFSLYKFQKQSKK